MMQITKTWFEDGKMVTETIPTEDVYKREWVGLTHDERLIIINDWQWQEGKPYHLCLSIENKLREKNT